MATAATAGFKGELFLSTSTGGAVAKIAELRNYELTVEVPMIDAKSRDSGTNPDSIPGIESWSWTAEYLEVSTNAGHRSVFDVAIAATKIKCELYPTGSSSEQSFTGEGYMENWGSVSPNDDAAASNVSFRGTGALTRTSTG